MFRTAIARLRCLGMIEGTSFLVLLLIAMPLKYIADRPEAVKVVGWLHGVLFVAFCWALLAAARQHAWPLKRIALIFIAALIPFGPFVIDRSLKLEDEPTHQPQEATS